jgi:hypothetical protein
MMQQSESIAAIGAAMAIAQGAVEGATKGKVNPAFKSKYADLSSVWAACREALFDNDLSVVQFPGEMVDNRLTLTTQLTHKSGEWMRATLSIPLSKVDAQGYGSAVTYARRYALAAVVGVCPEDDDGNAASRPAPRPNPMQDVDPPASKPIKLAGPYSSKTALWTAYKAFVREIESCGDLDQFLAFVATDESRALQAQIERDASGLVTGEGQPPEYEPMPILLKRKHDELNAADDTWKRDVTRAG